MTPTPFLRSVAVVAAATALVLVAAATGQPQPDPLAPPANGPRKADPTWHAFINATVHPAPGQTLEHATVVIRDGRIISVQAAPAPRGDGGAPPSPAPPDGARVWDCTDLHIYPGFIDPYIEVDAARPGPDSPGQHWNPRITPQRSALDGKGIDASTAESLRKLGFTAAAISPKGGIFRGTSAVVSLAKPDDDLAIPRPPVYRNRAYQAVAFDTSGGGRASVAGGGNANSNWPSYPDSQMGAIALIRQTLIDADWQAQARASGALTGAFNALDALYPHVRPSGQFAPSESNSAAAPLPLLFNTDDELESLRAAKIAAEFARSAIILGCGTEFRRLAAISENDLPHIIPLNFPEPPKVASIGQAESVDLRDLMTWEQAPTNPRRLDAAGLTVALTTSQLKDRSKFAPNLRKAILHGLPEDKALAMLTTTPARLLGVADSLGTLKPGKVASFTIADGPIFAKKTQLRDAWVDGKRHELNPAPVGKALEGQWKVELQPPIPDPVTLIIKAGTGAGVPTVKIKSPNDEGKDVTVTAREIKLLAGETTGVGSRLSWIFDHDDFGQPGVFTISAAFERAAPEVESATKPGGIPLVMHGEGTRADGGLFRWSALRTSIEADDQPDKKPGKEGEDKADQPDADAKPAADDPITGTWSGTSTSRQMPDGMPFTLSLTMTPDGAVSGTISSPMGSLPIESASFARTGADSGTLKFEATPPGGAITVTLNISADSMTGSSAAGPMTFDMSGKRSSRTALAADDEDDEPPKDIPEKLALPFGAYALDSIPDQPAWLEIRGATVWTCGPAGVIPNGTIIIKNGKIDYVGSSYTGPRPDGAIEVDLPPGRHITPGLIDCHSHTGISRGVNESGQAVTAEVRIQDVTDPGSMSWYWQLAGGITSVNNLHGSANPIGGQNCVNKNRWGAVHPDDLHFEGAPSGIKFALGENVKQSNWGDAAANSGRYPKSRMGVDTLIRDRFIAAREYAGATGRRSDGATKGESENAYASSNIPGSDRLAASDGPGAPGLQGDISHAGRGEIRTYDADAPGRGVDPLQHRGGPRAIDQDGLPEVPADRARIAGGALDPARTRHGSGSAAVTVGDAGPAVGNRSDPSRPDSFTRSQGGRVTPPPLPSSLHRADPSSLRPFVAPSLPPRRDLELEALAEILEGTRLVHCHSYRQDEILMLCRIADDFAFKIGTFQHILEGYKVADEVRDHALGASAFSDWWAYKVEVQDAIPYAGAIMHDVGAVVSFNSDSDELARRMNVEAGKAVRYGGLPTDEALKFVTLNPAKQLKVDAMVGSLEPGKHADLAIWHVPIPYTALGAKGAPAEKSALSGGASSERSEPPAAAAPAKPPPLSESPLSTLALCEATYIDGRCYFSLDQDQKLRAQNHAERQRLLQKLLASQSKKKKDAKTDSDKPDAKPDDKKPESPPWETTADAVRSSLMFSMLQRAAESRREFFLDLLRRGIDPATARCGDCGESLLGLEASR